MLGHNGSWGSGLVGDDSAESCLIRGGRSIEVSRNNFRDNSVHNWLLYQFFETSEVI